MWTSVGGFPAQVIPGPDEPQDRVDDEEGQHSDKKQVHKKAHKVKRRVELAHARIGMRLILHEIDIRASVALAAGSHQVGLVHGGMRVRLGAHIMRFMTIPTARRFHVAAQRAELGMECVAICAELVLVAGTADRRRLHAEPGRGGLLDGVRCVAVRAHGSAHLAGSHGLAMNALEVVRRDARVAFAARLRNVRLRRWALGVFTTENVMRPMAAVAIGGHQEPFLRER